MMETIKANSTMEQSKYSFIIKKLPLTLKETDFEKICESFGKLNSIQRNMTTHYCFVNYTYLRCSPEDVIFGFKQKGICANLTQRCLIEYNSTKQPDENAKICVYCSKEATTMCLRCKDFYCSVKCQNDDWPCHRYICYAMPKLVKINDSDDDVAENCSKIEEQLLMSPLEDVQNTDRGSNNVPLRNEYSSISNECTEPLKSLTLTQNDSLVVITGIKSTNVISARMCDPKTNREYRKIVNQISSRLEHAPSLTEMPKANSLVGAYCQDDGILYRVKILGDQNPNQSKIKVAYIDFGNEQFVDIKDLKELPKECQVLTVFPFAVELFGVPSRQNEVALKYLLNFESDDSQQFKLFRAEEDSSLSKLINLASGECLNAKIISLMEEKSSTEDAGHVWKSVLQAPFTTELLPIAENVPILILDNSLIKFGVFAACKREDLQQIEDFGAKLQEYGKLDQSPYEPVTNEYCLVNFPDDGCWYRGQVMNCLENGKFEVCFIDYGNESISTKQCIRRYPLEVTEPCRTSKCILYGLPKEISKDAENHLSKLFVFGCRMTLPKVIKYDDEIVIVENNNVLKSLEKLMDK